jgi:hypothetical protein
MSALIGFLNIYAPIAFVVAGAGVAYKVLSHLVRVLTRHHRRPVRTRAADAPPKLSFFAAARRVIMFPTTRFSFRANPVFVMGAVLYHIGIITISAGYGVSVALLGYHLLAGHPIPDISAGVSQADNHSISNLLAIIFGNGEPLPSAFLFGPLATLFTNVTWAVVVSALAGNTLLLYTHVRGRGGAIVRDLDPAAKGLRVKGMYKTSHLAVTAGVYAIIWTEILARLEVFPGMVYLHAILGTTLILIFPYTYLFHMLYGFVGIYYSARRYQERYIA